MKGLPCFADPTNLTTAEEPNAAEPEPRNALEYLQDVYRGRRVAESSRMRAAALALPFESPKLAVTAVISDRDFAKALDLAVARSQKVIELKPIADADR